MATEKVTADNFNEVVLKSATPVLVDFWAEWCGPCRAVAPILEEISNEYSGKIKIVKLNTDEEGSIAMKYGISSIPTMNVFVGGEVVKSIVGAKPKPALVRDLAEFLG
jgi:thioredoxin 1